MSCETDETQTKKLRHALDKARRHVECWLIEYAAEVGSSSEDVARAKQELTGKRGRLATCAEVLATIDDALVEQIAGQSR